MTSLRNILLVFFFPGLTVAQEKLLVGSADGAPDTTVLMPVSLEKNNPVVGVEFTVSYSPALVETALPAIESATDHFITAKDGSSGTMKVAIMSPSNAELPSDLKLRVPLSLLSTSPSGGPSLTVSNILFTDAFGNPHPANASYTLIESWRQAHFTPAERQIPGIVGDDANPDGDTLPNLFEFLAGLNPRANDATTLPFSLEESGGNTFLNLRFQLSKDPGVRNAATLGAQASSNLFDWSALGVNLVFTGNQTALTEEVEASVEDIGEPQKFLRLTGSRNEGE